MDPFHVVQWMNDALDAVRCEERCRPGSPPVTQTTEASNLLKREQVALPLQLGVKPLLFLCLKPIIRSMLKPLKSLGEVNFYSPLLACGFADKLPYFAPLGFK